MINFIVNHWVFGVGFLAQAFFGLRILVQWRLAEKQGKTVSPVEFWVLSLMGSTLFLWYGVLRHDVVIVLGQLIGYAIYVRNLQLKNMWTKLHRLIRSFVILMPVIATGVGLYNFPSSTLIELVTNRHWSYLTLIGMVGQLLLNFRFVYQLYCSEKRKESVLPMVFWKLSIAGSLLSIVYALYREDPVLLLAQGLAIIPYSRNVILLKKSDDSSFFQKLKTR